MKFKKKSCKKTYDIMNLVMFHNNIANFVVQAQCKTDDDKYYYNSIIKLYKIL